MKFRNFILTASICAATLWPSTACVDYEDPSFFNLFLCTPEMPEIDRTRQEESSAFWAKYTGLPVDHELKKAISYMYESHFDEDNDGNLLITTLRQQGKTDALQLVRLNFELGQLIDNRFSWSYKKTTPADYQTLLARIDGLRLTGELGRRKTFLKMRCLFALQDYDTCMRLWEMFASKWEDSPLRRRAYGYIAGIYYRTGRFEEAMQIYFKQGDEGSIRQCVNRILQRSTLQEQYDKDPNAPILSHFLEDYANYFYHSTFDDFWRENEKDNPIWSAVNRQREQVLALAERAVKEGKSQDPQMWQAFIGFIQLAHGENEQAYQSLVKAEQMKKGVMADRIGLYKLAASLSMEQKPAGYDDYLGKALDQYLTIAEDYSYSNATRGITYSMLQYEIKNRLNAYIEATKPGYVDYLNDMIFNYSKRIYLLDRMHPAEDVRPLLALLQNGTDDVLTSTLLKHSELTLDATNEYYGTLLMREGKYEEAATYLEKVSQRYIWNMGIMPYLFMRDVPERLFTRKDYKEYYDMEFIEGNPKLKFCRQVIDLKQQVAKSKKDEKAKAAITLANLLFQASEAGDMWAMSEYYWTSYGPHFNELDLQAIPYLHEAIKATKDPDLLTQAYFGLAATPMSENEIPTIASTGIFYADADPELLESYKTNIEGYTWLIKHGNRSHEFFQTCDWLKLYRPDAID